MPPDSRYRKALPPSGSESRRWRCLWLYFFSDAYRSYEIRHPFLPSSGYATRPDQTGSSLYPCFPGAILWFRKDRWPRERSSFPGHCLRREYSSPDPERWTDLHSFENFSIPTIQCTYFLFFNPQFLSVKRNHISVVQFTSPSYVNLVVYLY